MEHIHDSEKASGKKAGEGRKKEKEQMGITVHWGRKIQHGITAASLAEVKKWKGLWISDPHQNR